MVAAIKGKPEGAGSTGKAADAGPKPDPKLAGLKKESDDALNELKQVKAFADKAKAKWGALKNHPGKNGAFKMLDDRLHASYQKYKAKHDAYEKALHPPEKKPAYDKSTSAAAAFGGSPKKRLEAFLAANKKPSAGNGALAVKSDAGSSKEKAIGYTISKVEKGKIVLKTLDGKEMKFDKASTKAASFGDGYNTLKPKGGQPIWFKYVAPKPAIAVATAKKPAPVAVAVAKPKGTTATPAKLEDKSKSASLAPVIANTVKSFAVGDFFKKGISEFNTWGSNVLKELPTISSDVPPPGVPV